MAALDRDILAYVWHSAQWEAAYIMTKKRLFIFSGLVLGVVVGFVVSGQLASTRQPGITPEQAGNVSELQNQAIAEEITTDELLAELRAIAREQSPAAPSLDVPQSLAPGRPDFAFESQVHVDNFHGGVSGTYRCFADGWITISEAGRVNQIMPGSPESLSGLLVYPIDRVRSGSAMSKEPVDFPLGAADPLRNGPLAGDGPIHFDQEGKLVVGWAICRALPVGDWDVRLPR